LASEVTNLSGYQTKALNQFAHRNLIINGDMQIAQRSSSVASLTTSGIRTADRWRSTIGVMGTWTNSVENDAPIGSGFLKSLKMLCTTADASPSASDVCGVDQRLEGLNLQSIKKGTAAAEQLTISFWVKSNVIGTYIVNLIDHDNNRNISKSYSISSSATWEKKTITFPADTTGAFDNDSELSLSVNWGLGAGSDFTSGTLATSWETSTIANRFVGQVNLASAINNYWQVTGVQLEVGDTATPFEFLPADVELAACQRYYTKFLGTSTGIRPSVAVPYSTTNALCAVHLPVTMRTAPTTLDYNSIKIETPGSGTFTVTSASLDGASQNNGVLNAATTGMTQWRPLYLWLDSTSSYVAFSAEL
jgi:hypothetical protein